MCANNKFKQQMNIIESSSAYHSLQIPHLITINEYCNGLHIINFNTYVILTDFISVTTIGIATFTKVVAFTLS